MRRIATNFSIRCGWSVLFIVFSICLFNARANSQIVINFSEGDQLDGDAVGDTASFTDPTTGISTTMTHTGGHVGMFIDTFNFGLGLGPVDTTAFDLSESWVYQFDKEVIFKSLTLTQVSVPASDQFYLQCDEWIGKGYVPGDSGRASFNNTTGQFTLDRGITGSSLQTWDLDDLTGGAGLLVSPNTNISMSVGDFTDVTMTEMIWGTVVRPTADSFAIGPGNLDSGGLAELAASDNQYLIMDPIFTMFRYQLKFTVDATSPIDSPCLLEFNYESKTLNVVGTIDQTIELFNYDSGQYEQVDSRLTTNSDTVVTVRATGDLSRFVQSGTGAIRARISNENSFAFWVFQLAGLFLPFETRVDHIFWTITT